MQEARVELVLMKVLLSSRCCSPQGAALLKVPTTLGDLASWHKVPTTLGDLAMKVVLTGERCEQGVEEYLDKPGSMKWITKQMFAVEMLSKSKTISVVDRDKPDGGKTITGPNRTTTKADGTSSANI